ncbi:hypothetical protein [Streptomyces soliscabiei]|uniref:hypothetical protein n=1 Tax=Streptomyces soliscabiei TaxID=588897 RepID=UPI00299FAF3D|nr:hypothetical protein [Streptomyces sp. NY05-11A]MDX2677586.1 hypothetical protein [Streptomyces sp. NY05-11A]
MTAVRLRQSAVLARMLLVFFRRRVLRAGVLKSTPVRVFVLVAAVLLLGVMCTAAYFFLRPLADEAPVWRLLFDTSTVSLVLWVQIAFLLVKVLFINAEGMLQLSYQLPVTNRERATAFLMYEAAMTAVVAAAGLVSLSVSALILLGPSATGYITASVVLPVTLTYLVLSVLYQLLTRMWMLVGLSRMAGLLNVLVLFAVLAFYSAQMTSMIQDISGAYLDKRTEYTWVTSVSWGWNELGPWSTLAAVAALSVALVVLAFALAPNQHVRQSRYLKLPGSVRLRGILGPYDWCLLRSAQTVAAAAMAFAVFVYLLLAKPSVNPMWGLAALSFGGLYQFTATQPLRMLPGARASAWQVYARLIRAQTVLLAVFAVPALAITTAVHPDRFLSSSVALASCLGGSVMTTCISVVFPAEKDNPFSVFLGLSVVAVVLGLSVIGLGMLSLPPWAVVACLGGAAVAFVWYAVQGIHASESRRRNAQGTVGRESRRRGRAAHSGHGGGDPARPHVLNGQ